MTTDLAVIPPQAKPFKMVDWFNRHFDDIEVILDKGCSVCNGSGLADGLACVSCDGSGDDSTYQLEGIRGNIYQLYYHFSPSKSLAVFLSSFGIEGEDKQLDNKSVVEVRPKDVKNARTILNKLGKVGVVIACSEVAQ